MADEARVALGEILESTAELIHYSQAGGMGEHAFNLHADADLLARVARELDQLVERIGDEYEAQLIGERHE